MMNRIIIRSAALLGLALFFLSYCTTETGAQLDGEELSKIYCIGCHAYPEPEDLPKHLWKSTILPRMGHFLGFYASANERAALIEQNQGGQMVEDAGIYPKEPLLESTEWSAIQKFYLDAAPDSLMLPVFAAADTLSQFDVKIPDYFMSPPAATLVKIKEKGGFYLGDANQRSTFVFDSEGEMIDRAQLREGPVWLEERQDALYILVMGSFSPTDAPSGFLVRLPKDKAQPPQILIQGLQRPVHFEMEDVNGDGIEDFLICEFGKWTGGLSLWLSDGNTFAERQIDQQSGATKAYFEDINQDGQKDIVALFAQGQERITAYIAKEGSFERKDLLRFQPSWGSSFMRLTDWDEDGDLDILYTAGDNADYAPILKPYHGIYRYENDGLWNFSLLDFRPLYGAYNAMMADFDEDGQSELAAISFFPDFTADQSRGFVYYDDLGEEERQTVLPSFELGRWITMDAGDLDGDGDLDLILGSLTMEVPDRPALVQAWVDKGIPFVVLENITN